MKRPLMSVALVAAALLVAPAFAPAFVPAFAQAFAQATGAPAADNATAAPQAVDQSDTAGKDAMAPKKSSYCYRHRHYRHHHHHHHHG